MKDKVPQWFDRLYPQEVFELMLHFEIADEEKFCDAFMSRKDWYLRRKAVLKIQDQDRLWHFAVHDPDKTVRSEAARRLTDDARKYKIVHEDKDREVRIAAAEKLTDKDLLRELATANPDSFVRRAAILRMTDDDDLMEIVFSDKEDNYLRLIAASRVQDEECLKRIINSREELSAMDHHNAIRDSRDVRRAAVLRVRDHDLLRSLAADYGEAILVRVAATGRLGPDDQDILEMIAEKPYDPDPRTNPDLYYNPELRAAAVSRLTDRELLRRCLDDREKETQAAARLALGALESGQSGGPAGDKTSGQTGDKTSVRVDDKFSGQALLKDTVEDEYWPLDVRTRALELITDRDFVYHFAKKHICFDKDERELAKTAARMVKDPVLLAEIAMGANELEVSQAAVEILDDDKQLLRVINEIEDHKDKWLYSIGPELQYVWEQELKIAAARNLDDLRPLVKLALADPGEHYSIHNFKEYSIGLLSVRPDLMLEYVREETDEYALSLAANDAADEEVLQTIADKGLRDSYAEYKLKNIRRVGEVGLKPRRKDMAGSEAEDNKAEDNKTEDSQENLAESKGSEIDSKGREIDSKTAGIIKYWYEALTKASKVGEAGFTEFAGEEPGQEEPGQGESGADSKRLLKLAKLRVLWLLHAGRHLDMFMHSGEVYEEWEKCTELSSLILKKAVEEAMVGDWSTEEAAELEAFRAGCGDKVYETRDIREKLHEIFSGADEETLEKIDEEIRRRVDFVRWKLYDAKFARKDEVEAPFRKYLDEPPPGMDEFEYIDWMITH